MKHTFKTLLGLVLVVFVLAGCSNPAGPETPEVNEPPVVETPEDTSNLTKVEFRWGKDVDINNSQCFYLDFPRYLLGLRSENNKYVFDYPEGYTPESYCNLVDYKDFTEYSKGVFEDFFGTKYYKEGAEIDLTKWTSEALDLVMTNEYDTVYTRLCFLTEDVEDSSGLSAKDSLDRIVVGNEDMVIYIYWDNFGWF